MKKISNNTKWKISLFLLSSLLNCNPDSGKKENEDLTNLLLLNQLTSATVASTFSCTLPDTATGGPRCFDYGTSTSSSSARSHCSTNSGTFSATSACSTTRNSVGTCSGTITSSGISVKINYFDYYKSFSNFASSITVVINALGSNSTVYGVADRCSINDGITSGATTVLSTKSPRIRFVNNSGISETHTFHTSTACGAGTKYATYGTIANGITGSYMTLTERTLPSSISSSDGANCSTLSYFFSNGNVWTSTSTPTNSSVAATIE
ncbi:MAG: hypothetical protein SH817_08730 [Leptospira sp.]|nr:hypothetical protein [Leptospira sp.]